MATLGIAKRLEGKDYRQSDRHESDERPRWLACSFCLDRFQILIRKDQEDLNESKDSSMPICHLLRCDADENNETAVRLMETDGDIQITISRLLPFIVTCSLISIRSFLVASQTNAMDCSYSYLGVAVPGLCPFEFRGAFAPSKLFSYLQRINLSKLVRICLVANREGQWTRNHPIRAICILQYQSSVVKHKESKHQDIPPRAREY